MTMYNPYLPVPVQIEQITLENTAKDLKTFQLRFEREEDRRAFTHLPGQFAELSIFGYGEAPFGIASSPTEEEYLLFTVKRVGSLTTELHRSEVGRRIGVRGPLGNAFPWERMQGKHLVIVSGGFAFTTLRAAITYMLHPRHRSQFGDITVIYGAREPGELLYQETLAQWEADPSLDLILTIDRPVESGEWHKRVGLVPKVVKEVAPSAENAMALVCGPPIMIRFTIPELLQQGFAKEDIILSLENRMKCGIGKCGHCNVGPKYVCLDGPVFSYADLEPLPAEY